ncbi:MAG: hypothetical protein P8Y80_08920 [Acidobacteriota bacterium]
MLFLSSRETVCQCRQSPNPCRFGEILDTHSFHTTKSWTPTFLIAGGDRKFWRNFWTPIVSGEWEETENLDEIGKKTGTPTYFRIDGAIDSSSALGKA